MIADGRAHRAALRRTYCEIAEAYAWAALPDAARIVADAVMAGDIRAALALPGWLAALQELSQHRYAAWGDAFHRSQHGMEDPIEHLASGAEQIEDELLFERLNRSDDE